MSFGGAAFMWRSPSPLVLASGSQTRRKMLADRGIPFVAVASDVDERAIEANLVATGAAGDRVALDLAIAKARAVSAQRPGDLTLGADQTLTMAARRFAKPGSREAAREQLRALSGRVHSLFSAAALVVDGVLAFSVVEEARLAMRPLSETFIDAYLDACGEDVFQSVGAYQIEGRGLHLFERVEGDRDVILGLPMMATLAYLRRAGHLLG